MKILIMKIAGYVFTIYFLIAAGCSHKTTPLSAETKADTLQIEDSTERTKNISSDSSTYRFIVGFYSIGSGTETEQISKFKTFAGEYAQKIGKKISIEKFPWGREGEVDYCMHLENLSQDEQSDFISKTKDILKTAQWVHFFQNAECRHARKVIR